MDIFDTYESNVRSYCRTIPATFCTGKGPFIFDESGRRYIDLFCSAGALPFGHNPDPIREPVISYLRNNGVVSTLDFHSVAKRRFLETFAGIILGPRKMDYVVQFTGPTGTNAVEAALKLARLVTGRTSIVAFTNAYHGNTLGALALTGARQYRRAAGTQLDHVVRIEFEAYRGSTDGLARLDKMLRDPSSGIDLPAAMILEVVQAEGGVNTSSIPWLQTAAEICKAHGIILIIDDIQVGCGRLGTFFSFENAGLTPDIICLSKGLGGMGLPIAVNLIRRDLDKWEPGAHSGTFRGHNLAFVASAAMIEAYWSRPDFSASVHQRCSALRDLLTKMGERLLPHVKVRGCGFIWGIQMPSATLAQQVQQVAFENGVLCETCGPQGETLKLLPPLNSEPDVLEEAVDKLGFACQSALA